MSGKNKDGKKTTSCGAIGAKENNDEELLKENLDKIKVKIIVLSGKGGVGKSTVAVNLAAALSKKDVKVGLLDVDLHGPSVPGMLGLEGERLTGEGEKISPIDVNENLKAVSMGFLMENNREAVIWRGPAKYGAIKQFIKDVSWGELDYLIIDSPPGTGDEPLTVCQLVRPDGAIVVTTPQDAALLDVRKSITFCERVNIPVFGVVENMSGFVCPHCGESTDIFKKGGGKKMSDEMGVKFLGSVPIEEKIMENGDSGAPYIYNIDNDDSAISKVFEDIISSVEISTLGVKA